MLAFVMVLGYRSVRGRLGYPTIIPVGIDIDGVLGEQVPPVLERIQSKKGLGKNMTKKDITKWDLPINGTSIDREIEEALLDPEYVREMPVVQGSTSALTDLNKHFHVVITTSRPFETEGETISWLRKHFRFHEYANARLVGKEAIGLRFLVDDYPKNIVRFAASGGTALLFTQPWNMEEDSEVADLMRAGKVIRCHGWDDVRKRLSERRTTE